MNPEILNTPTVLAADGDVVPIGPDTRQSRDSSQDSLPTFDDDRLDWDTHIAIAPVRRSGSIQVKLEFGGRGKPTPIDDPSA